MTIGVLQEIVVDRLPGIVPDSFSHGMPACITEFATTRCCFTAILTFSTSRARGTDSSLGQCPGIKPNSVIFHPELTKEFWATGVPTQDCGAFDVW